VYLVSIEKLIIAAAVQNCGVSNMETAKEPVHKPKPLSFSALNGISDKTNQIHHDKLYVGYVNKRNEIEAALGVADKSKANATYSEFGELKRQETFAANGMILHELFFGLLGGDGAPAGKLVEKIAAQFGSFDARKADMIACAMSARGWAVLAFDFSDMRLHNYTGDAHNQGGVWGAVPLLALDVYEHAYFLDFGSDRKAYLEAFFKNVNWAAAAERAKKMGVV
jgi:Fe-Mn family superoxide dismutase